MKSLSLFFNGFTEDAGYMPVNSSVFFHFINMKLDEAINNEEGMNFSVFRIIGKEKYFITYLTNIWYMVYAKKKILKD